MILPGVASEYHPPLLLRNGHANTIYPYFFRRIEKPPYTRNRISTYDDDFLHVDLLGNGHRRLAIVCHGLEGSSDSQYIKGLTHHLSSSEWDVAAMNYRYCTEEINLQPRAYHSGATEDLQAVVEHFTKSYDQIVMVGFSLGGNLVLKYCGERGTGLDSNIVACVAVSVPTDLHAGSINIGSRSNYFYEQRFLDTLKKKMIKKHEQFPDVFQIEKLKLVKTLYDFDDLFTGPIHGFHDARDYYTRASSGQFLHSISIPTLMINALDDPFLPEECYPYKETESNPRITFLTPKHGGHVGFATLGGGSYWSEEVIGTFIEKNGGY